MWGLPAGFGMDPHIAPPAGGTYVNSVQHVSITIPTGAASATATIASVGPLAFILFNGFEATTSSGTHIGFARIELTNATTVTAYRNSSSATETVVARGCVVDATSSLVASVQSGVVTLGSASSSATDTIASTNASNTVIHLLGFTGTQTSLNLTTLEPVVSLSGTTVTVSRQSSSSIVTVGYVVIEFNGAALQSATQSYSKSWTNSGTSTTQALTSVDPDNTLLFFCGSYANSSGSEAKGAQRVALTNATTATITTNTAGVLTCRCNFGVVEFIPGVLNGPVQRGSTTLTASASNSSSISSVTVGMALVSFQHFNATQISADISNAYNNVELTNATTVTTSRNGTSGNVLSSWEVAQFN